MSTQILMPALSPTMEEGKLAKWLVKEGDEVKSGDILAEIETDKATMEFEAVDEGRIGKILVPEGAEGVKVNQPIAVLLEEGENTSTSAAASAPSGSSISLPQWHQSRMRSRRKRKSRNQFEDRVEISSIGTTPPHPALSPRGGEGDSKGAALAPAERGQGQGERESKPVAASEPKSNGRVFASPLAKRLAAQAGVDLSSVHGSGPRGRIVKSDIESVQKGGSARTAPPSAAGKPASASPTGGEARIPASRRCRTRSCSSSRKITSKSRTIRCGGRSPNGFPPQRR